MLLSSVVYLALTGGGMVFFYERMNASLDAQLEVLSSELGHAIDVKGSQPVFRDWLRIVQTEPARSLGPIQLFDRHRVLLDAYGAKGPLTLSTGQKEVSSPEWRWRVRVTPLTHNDQVVGYLQIGIPTRERDGAIKTLGLTVAIIAPLVIAGLGICSYIVSAKAAAPLETNLKLMRRFVADAGHELNTPLAIVLARVETLRKKLNRESVTVGNTDLDAVEGSLARMNTIVTDLMLLSEMEGQRDPLSMSTTNILSLLNSVRTEFIERAQDAGTVIHINCDVETAPLQPDMIFRLLANLVENALRYSKDSGSVTLSAHQTEAALMLEVADDGIGIPSQNLPHVFERFYRVDDSRSRTSGGTGLGLSIVKAIAEAHGGNVSIKSAVDKGTTVTVTLPLTGRTSRDAQPDRRHAVEGAAPETRST